MNKQKQKPNRKDKKKNVKGDAFQRVEFLKEVCMSLEFFNHPVNVFSSISK